MSYTLLLKNVYNIDLQYSIQHFLWIHFVIILLQHFSGLEEAVYRNISACKQFSDTVRTAYGPNGMNKIIINHIEKLFVTNDAATIIKELEVNIIIILIYVMIPVFSGL